jgi:V/A-type H+-transporting ATPase subunit I
MLTRLARIVVMGVAAKLELAEDVITALCCMDVTDVQRGGTHFEITGWVPEAWLSEFESIMEEVSEGVVIVAADDKAEGAQAPILMENPNYAKPFEVLVEMFSLPGRGEFDPTLITTLVLPLFFGFVIGDIGHGALLVLLAWFVGHRVRTPVGRLASRILGIGGAWAIAVGIAIFHEAFAFSINIPGMGEPLLDRRIDIAPLLVVSLIIGVVHLALGLAVGFWYERRRAGIRLAVLRKASWLILEAGGVLFVLAFLGVIAGAAQVWALAMVALGVLLVGIGGGFVDVIEIPSFFTSILSYARLAALGIAEALIGGVVNEMALGVARSDGTITWAFSVIVFAIGHAAFLAFAVLIVTLQVIRLHYVEFFPRFYQLDEIGRPKAFRSVTTVGE